jgi:hypothetical protein
MNGCVDFEIVRDAISEMLLDIVIVDVKRRGLVAETIVVRAGRERVYIVGVAPELSAERQKVGIGKNARSVGRHVLGAGHGGKRERGGGNETGGDTGFHFGRLLLGSSNATFLPPEEPATSQLRRSHPEQWEWRQSVARSFSHMRKKADLRCAACTCGVSFTRRKLVFVR